MSVVEPPVGDATLIVTETGAVVVVEAFVLFDPDEYDDDRRRFDVWYPHG